MNSHQEIRVGLSISLTGKYSRQGQQALDGIHLWESYINGQGGIRLGTGQKPVRLIFNNDHSRASRAKQNTLRLLQFDQVDVLLGPYASDLTLAAASVTHEHQRTLWNHGGASDDIHTRGFRLVSTLSPASDYLRGLPKWLAGQWPSLRRICVLQAANGTFAFQVTRGLVEAVNAIGERSIRVFPFKPHLVKSGAILGSLGSVAPEVVVLAASFEDEVRLLRARARWPRSVKVVAAVAAGVHAFSEELDELAEGVIGPSQWEPELRFSDIRSPASAWFVRNFHERFGHLPEYTAASSFATGLVVAECICHAGTLDDQAVRQAAAELDFNTFFGNFRIDAATGRQTGHRALLIQWQQGRKVVLGGAG